MNPARLLVAVGAVSACIAVGAGAFGVHALRERIGADLLAVFETGARYQMYHALAVLASAWVYDRLGAPQALWSGWLFVAGSVLFSGSLYLLALSGARWWGAVTPVGGLAFVVGWLLLAWAALAAW